MSLLKTRGGKKRLKSIKKIQKLPIKNETIADYIVV